MVGLVTVLVKLHLLKKEGAHKTKKGAHKNIEVAVDELAENGDLTEKQKLFCLYYLQRFNATWAYQQAYGGDYDTARNSGPRLIANDCIKEALDKLRRQQQSELFITATDILKEYIKQATASLGDVLDYESYEQVATDNDGNPVFDSNERMVKFHQADIHLKPSSQIDWSTVEELRVGRDGLVVKLYDKQKAMKELLDRLPEPQNDDVSQDTFLKAIINAKQKKRW
ncbi:terminase small subunit [Secundilactobacillus oryzae]|uniref:terminase small subunit n=1 Tax=Secundilactobacillus oryzae TaxID=1202668 RepID=UPI000B02018C